MRIKKTPISYYGGKQSMLKHILPIIPNHTIYVEPFFGGGAVFWVKSSSRYSNKRKIEALTANYPI